MKAKIGNLLGSVATKILAIMFALVGTTLAAILVSGSLISTIDKEAQRLATDAVPPLEAATGVSNAVSTLKDSVNALLVTQSQLALPDALANLQEARATLQEQIGKIDADKYPQMAEEMSILLKDLSTLGAAREKELAAQNQNLKAMSALNRDTRILSAALEDRISRQTFSLAMAGNTATAKASRSMRNLMKHNVDALRLVLMLRIELTEFMAHSQALLRTNDEARVNEILTQANDVKLRIDALLKSIKKNKAARDYLPDVQGALEFPYKFIELSAIEMKMHAGSLYTAQSDINDLMARTIDEVLTELDNVSGETLQDNEVTLRGLIEDDVRGITDLASIDTSVKSVLIKAMQGTSSSNFGYIHALQLEIDEIMPNLLSKVERQPEELKTLVHALLETVNPETGLLATRVMTLEARSAGFLATEAVGNDLLRVSSVAIDMSADSMSGISKASQTLLSTASDASNTMNAIGLVALVIVLASPVLTFFFIMRPLIAVTKSTERLAIGDMGEITCVGGRHGEIARLFGALSVFRNNLVEKEQMEKEAAERKEAEAAAKAKAEREAHEREAAELARQQEQERSEREREAAAEAERRALEEAAEAERQARHAEQSAVVEALADGLRRMSQGDIRHTIDQEFPGSYEQLRKDYNAAILSLRSVVEQLSVSAQTVHSNSGEISNAATDLSHRTERAASTLGETASALTELTAAVKSAADGANLANSTVAGARSNAESASSVVKDAISAMDAISESSDKISKIISVIDDIAFQTNLLALNAGVEAARAGDAGRGFAVVASEVRALAQRSSEAAREINTLISESGQEVGRGVALVDQTGEALRSIVQDVSAISTHMSEIATSAEQQSAGISEINSAVANLDQATQQNAAMFEETTAASVSLAHEAEALTDIVAQFRLDDAEGYAGGSDGASDWSSETSTTDDDMNIAS